MTVSLGWRKRWSHWLCLGLLVAIAPFSLSCYGRFPLTKAVYGMNGRAGRSFGADRTQHKLVQSVVMWVLWIIPVYEVAIFADAFVLNLIEFWTGDTIEVGSVQERDGVQVALEPKAGGHEAVLTISRDGQLLTEQHVVKVSDTVFEMRDPSGNLSGTVQKTASGGIELRDAQGQVVKTLAAEDLAALHQG